MGYGRKAHHLIARLMTAPAGPAASPRGRTALLRVPRADVARRTERGVQQPFSGTGVLFPRHSGPAAPGTREGVIFTLRRGPGPGASSLRGSARGFRRGRFFLEDAFSMSIILKSLISITIRFRNILILYLAEQSRSPLPAPRPIRPFYPKNRQFSCKPPALYPGEFRHFFKQIREK